VPITFTPNPFGPQLGPGIPIGWSSDFVGPLPVGSFWHVMLYQGSEPTINWYDVRIPTQSPFAGRWWPFTQNVGANQTVNINNTLEANQPAHVTVELNDGNGVVDSGTLSGTWDVLSGLPMQIEQKPIGSGSFTAQDRQNLQLAVSQSAVDLTSTAVPTDLHTVPVGKLPGDVPLLWSERVGPFTLTGRGTLDLLGQGIRGIWTGMRWFYEVIPPQWGMKPGAIDEFQPRPAQLVPIFALGSGEEIGSPILDTNSSGGFSKLELFAFTGKIAYDVSPGWTVSLFMYRVIASG